MSAEVSRILVVRLGSMGDIIHALPAVAMLRRAFPGATIGWAVERRWSALLSSEAAISGPRSPAKPLVDVVHGVDTFAWRRAPFSDETWREASAAVGQLRDLRYELAIDFQGAWKSSILAQLSRAPRRIGFMQPREKPATLFYTHQVAARGRHIVEQNISLAEGTCGPMNEVRGAGLRPGYAGQRPAPDSCFPLPQDPSGEHSAEQQLRFLGFHSFAIINPGAGWGAKCWPAERYGQVARALAVHGLRSIVNYGPGEEELARAVEAAANGGAPRLSSPEPAPNRSEGVTQGGSAPNAIAIPTTVSELIALTRRARLFIGGDTGPMHLAAALGIPVVALFGPTDPARNGPYATPAIVLRSDLSRTTTSHEKRPDQGLLQLTAADVIAAARYLLARPAEARP